MCRYLSSAAQADDLAQETYARAFAGLHRFVGRSTARTWLLAIARHVCADAVARAVRARRRPVEPAGVVPDHAGTVEVDLLLRTLRPDRREAVCTDPAAGVLLRRGGRCLRVPGRHHPLPGRSRPRGPAGRARSGHSAPRRPLTITRPV